MMVSSKESAIKTVYCINQLFRQNDAALHFISFIRGTDSSVVQEVSGSNSDRLQAGKGGSLPL